MKHAKIQRCGTYLGYTDHRRNGTKPGIDCPDGKDCLAAYAAHMFEYRHRTGRSKRTIVPDVDLTRYGVKVSR